MFIFKMRFLFIKLVLLFQVVQCIVYTVEVKQPMVGFSYRTLNGMAMYSPKDAPLSGPPGDGRSFIKFKNFQFDRIDELGKYEAAALQLIVLPHYDVKSIGINHKGENVFCCTSTIMNQGKYNECKDESHLNRLITKIKSYDNAEDGNYKLVEFAEGVKHVKIPEWNYPVKESKVHMIAVAVCDARVGEVTLSGETEWMNPYGHLPAQLYGFLPFYGWMCVVYLAASIVWLVLNVMYLKDLLHVQNCITCVLVMCVIEMLIWYCDYYYLNNNGVRRSEVFVFAIIISVSRRTVARMLVLAVSLGYGVVKPTLRDEKTKIVVLGALYWVFAFVFEVFLHYSQTQDVSPIVRTLLRPPVALIDGYFWWWIFTSLNDTLVDLKQNKQNAKYILFKKFSGCLGFSLMIAFVFACYQLHYVWTEQYLQKWKIMWILEVGFWQVLFTIVFFCIMFLWRPSRHASKYAYAQQISTEEHDDADLFEETLGGKPDTAEAADEDRFVIGEDNRYDQSDNVD